MLFYEFRRLHIGYSLIVFDFFFFFKQKTAYEMRISDWSSDVCSSDLSVRSASAPGTPLPATGDRSALRPRPKRNQSLLAKSVPTMFCAKLLVSKLSSPGLFEIDMTTRRLLLRTWSIAARWSTASWPVAVPLKRSEEHTSELQSLMRISYAVFCLK